MATNGSWSRRMAVLACWVLLLQPHRSADVVRAQVTPPLPSPPGQVEPVAVRSPGAQRAVTAGTAEGVAVLAGWNLVSLPASPADPSPAEVFASLGATFRRAYVHDACDTADPWKVYDPADSAGSDLTEVDESDGIWVEATGDAGLLPLGEPPLSTSIHLCPGWNLVGFPAAQPRPVRSALSSIEGKYIRVLGHEITDPMDPWEIYDVAVPAWANDLRELRPGRGYWILVTEETDLEISDRGGELSVQIAAPANLVEVTGPVDVTGTVQGQILASWELHARRVGEEGDEVLLGSGTTAVAGGVLGRFDPTLRLNGLWEIELAAYDSGGAGVSVATHVLVEGQRKVGSFSVSFLDLEVPVSGLSIQVVRTYDTRDLRSGDFGHGWTLDIRQGSYRNNRKPGEGWRIVDRFIPCQAAQETLPHLTTIRLSDREIYHFRLRLLRPALTAGGCFAEAGFELIDGPVPGATLEILDGSEVFYANGTSRVVDPETQEPFEPRQVRLTTRDGRLFDLDLFQGVTRLADPNGNELTLTPEGIVHSGGQSVAFERDASGRIVRITDPAGEAMEYEYDSRGDLVAFTDREEQVSRYSYDAAHRLESIEDPRGIRSVRNEYDDAGRLVRHIDTSGKVLELTHDLEARREVITDRLGHSRLLEYDGRGNLVRETDALGKVILRSFDENDLLLSETDPLGQTTTYRYDAARNLVEQVNPLGHRTSYTHDAHGRILTMTDARGKVTRNHWDERGNLLSVTDPLGHTTTHTYDSRGNLATQTEPEGHQTVYAYDSAGRLVKETDPLGQETRFTHDANGNLRTRTLERATATGRETLTWRFAYDALGRVTQVTGPDGATARTVYDGTGQVIESIDTLERRTVHTYDDMGRRIRTRHPDGTTEESTYDAEGRRTSFRDRGGRSTVFAYDAAGRLVSTTLSDGSTEARVYDDAGRLVAFRNTRGHATGFVYDAAGRQTTIRDALEQETHFVYNPSGDVTSVQDPLGNTTVFEYDDAGRLVQVTFPDGTSTRTTYDRSDRKVAEIDPAGGVKRFTYDGLGRLLTLTDALEQVTRFSYDEAGNQISQIDANGHETRFEHDALGRMTKRILPGGAFETFSYDAAGNLRTRTGFDGAAVTYLYDADSRVVERRQPDGSAVFFTYTPTGRRASVTDGRGVTSYVYDVRDRLLEMTDPGGRRLSYTYDSRGNRTSLTASIGTTARTTTYTYDALDRLEAVTDPEGRSYLLAYDANGNRTSLTHPNGVTTVYGWDALGRLTRLASATREGEIVQSYSYSLDSAGRRVDIDEHDGTRRHHAFDTLGRLTEERVTRGGSPLFRNGFTYDPVGNRLRQERVDASGATELIASTFDRRDRLVSANDVTYTWDAKGRQTGRSGPEGSAEYTWDALDRLVRVTLADGTVVRHGYDADGNRVRTEVTPVNGPPTATEYLIDPVHRASSAATGPALSQIVAEIDAGGQMTAYHVRGDDLLATLGENGPRNLHAEGIGTIRALTDEEGQVTDSYDLEAFGTLLSHQGSDSNAYLFTGEAFEKRSGLYHLRARWQQPETGAFLSLDPHPGSPFDPASLHRYQYAFNDPIDFTDPTGLEGTGGVNGLNLSGAISTVIRTQAMPVWTSIQVRGMTILVFTPLWLDKFSTWMDRATIALGALELMDRATVAWLNNPDQIPAGAGPRGYKIEEITPRNLGGNFPKIDDFRENVATSIKSHAVSSPEALAKSIRRDLRALDGIENTTLRGNNYLGQRVIIPQGEIQIKVLLVAIPETDAMFLNNPQFRSTVRQLHETYRTVIRVVPVKGWRR